MTTIRQIDRLWAGNDHRRMVSELTGGRPELTAVAQRLLGPAAAAAVAVIRLDELGQSHQPIVAKLLRSLIGAQQPDGGWGDLAVTILALRALRCCDGNGHAVERAITHLSLCQREDGAWPDEPIRRLPADGLTTAFLLLNLAGDEAMMGKLNLQSAADWLTAHRDELEPVTRRLADRAAAKLSRAGMAELLCAVSWS